VSYAPSGEVAFYYLFIVATNEFCSSPLFLFNLLFLSEHVPHDGMDEDWLQTGRCNSMAVLFFLMTKSMAAAYTFCRVYKQLIYSYSIARTRHCSKLEGTVNLNDTGSGTVCAKSKKKRILSLTMTVKMKHGTHVHRTTKPKTFRHQAYTATARSYSIGCF
jgi:hypothetical protein